VKGFDINRVVRNSFGWQQRHQCALGVLPRVLRQRLIGQHAERIEHRRVLLQVVSTGIEESQLHEALSRVALQGGLCLIALVKVAVVAQVLRV
jgi:hypothetical protein